jgi:uncharacterized phage-associated protein
MPITSDMLARAICERSNWTISNLALQKIAYMAHMVYLGRTGRPLVGETFEAWDYGPVLPHLYRRVRAFGRDPIRNVFHGTPAVVDPEQVAVIDEACENLLSRTPGQLVSLTHRPNGAWARNYRAGSTGNIIPNSDIADEYRNRTAG